jgi:hypothetical protein
VARVLSQQRKFPRLQAARSEGSALLHLGWFAAAAAVAFLVPYVFTTVVDTPHDLYYLIYFAVSGAFLAMYVRATSIDPADVLRRSWRWSLGLAVPVTAFVVVNVLSRDSTDGPSGLYAVFEVAWRGVAYGTVDALLLTAFPGVVAFSLLGRDISTLARRGAFVAIALPLVIVITATYHLGYVQFRDDGIAAPETGNAIISVPMLATANPIGSIVAHASMHVTADLHSYETDVFLPPVTQAPD